MTRNKHNITNNTKRKPETRTIQLKITQYQNKRKENFRTQSIQNYWTTITTTIAYNEIRNNFTINDHICFSYNVNIVIDDDFFFFHARVICWPIYVITCLSDSPMCLPDRNECVNCKCSLRLVRIYNAPKKNIDTVELRMEAHTAQVQFHHGGCYYTSSPEPSSNFRFFFAIWTNRQKTWRLSTNSIVNDNCMSSKLRIWR